MTSGFKFNRKALIHYDIISKKASRVKDLTLLKHHHFGRFLKKAIEGGK
jgi:F0F1-type ATP synthase alpha subunit